MALVKYLHGRELHPVDLLPALRERLTNSTYHSVQPVKIHRL